MEVKNEECKEYKDKTYDEINKYDFYTKRFLQYVVGTKYEGFIELNKGQYEILIKKEKKVNLINFIRELDTLQTRYGKEGVIGLANRILNKKKND